MKFQLCAGLVLILALPTASAILDATTIGYVGGIGGIIQNEWERAGLNNFSDPLGCGDAPREATIRVVLRDPLPDALVDAFGLDVPQRLSFSNPTALIPVSGPDSCHFDLTLHGVQVTGEVHYEADELCLLQEHTYPSCYGAIMTGCAIDRAGVFGPSDLNGICSFAPR